MNKEIIVHDNKHPLLALLIKSKLDHYSRSEMLAQRPQVVWDFTLGTTSEKREFYQELRSMGVQQIHADLTSCHGSLLIKEFPELQTAFASACWSPKESYELWQRDPEAEFGLLEIFPLQPVEVQSPGHCFTYPRVISTLINEARFAVRDGLAEVSDLDRAMKYGVNYPLGLVEWEAKIGKEIIDLILRDLREETHSDRYQTL